MYINNSWDGSVSAYDDLAAIWDAFSPDDRVSYLEYDGTFVTYDPGAPPGWPAGSYWSATSSFSGHIKVGFYTGYIHDAVDHGGDFVALQVL